MCFFQVFRVPFRVQRHEGEVIWRYKIVYVFDVNLVNLMIIQELLGLMLYYFSIVTYKLGKIKV